MTLKTRNDFIKFFFISSIIIAALSLITFILAFYSHKIITPPALRIPSFLNDLPFTPNSFPAVMVSFVVLILYVPVCFFLLIHFFEHTQTTEIIFFTGFLIACSAEIARFITICFGLWLTFSNLLIFMGTVVLFGRTLAPLSFLCAALLSETSQRQDIERNYVIMMIVSIAFAAVIPMNTAKISSTGLVSEGFLSQVNILRFLLLATTILSFYIHGIKRNSSEHKQLALSSLILLSGYTLMVSCDSYFFLIAGSAGLIYGTYRYMNYLHRLYMWSQA
ncbi:MAG: hypothetical protein K5873_04940 [Treponema sp.]|nr:hypothetical protein [Treponema sp.]